MIAPSNAEIQKWLTQRSPFVIPEFLLFSRLDAIKAVLGRSPSQRTVTVRGYKIDVLVFPGTRAGRKTYDLLFGEQGPCHDLASALAYESCVLGQRLVPVLARNTSDLDIPEHPAQYHPGIKLPNTTATAARDGVPVDRYASVVKMYLSDLAWLSSLTGWKIVIHTITPTTLEPFPQEERILHLVAGATPIGDRFAQYLNRGFGQNLTSKMDDVPCRLPVQGRGIVIKDDDDQAMVQLLGHTAYLLIPVLSNYHGTESILLFADLLRAVWNRIFLEGRARRKPPTKNVPKSDSSKALNAFVAEGMNDFHIHFGTQCTEIRDRIAVLWRDPLK